MGCQKISFPAARSRVAAACPAWKSGSAWSFSSAALTETARGDQGEDDQLG